MDIHCSKCGTYCGEIKEGSKLRKGLKYVCNECYTGRTGSDIPDFFKKVFGTTR